MTHDTRTSDDIERDIVAERAQMSETIDDLQKKFSVDAIVSDLGAMLRGQGGDLGRSIADTMGRNPVAVALVGVGLAWLFLGPDRKTAATASATGTGWASNRHRNWPTPGATVSKAATRQGSDQDSVSNNDRYWYGDGLKPSELRAPVRGANGAAKAPAGLDGAATGMMGTLRNAASTVGEAVTDAAGNLGDTAADWSGRLSHGLEDLTDEARARVVTARRAAHEARLTSTEALQKGTRAAAGFFEEQPLVAAGLAMALGAAIAGALPRSRVEDEALGDHSDRLFAEAQGVFRDERDKAMAVLRTAATDIKEEIGNVGPDLANLLPEGRSVGETIIGHAADAATRVIDGAKDEAKHQGLGRRLS